MEIRLETTVPVFRGDPNSYTRPVLVTVFGFDDQGSEYMVGQLTGDILHLAKAEEVGLRLIDVFDCDSWEEIYRDLIDKRGDWREELNFDMPVFELVVFYRIVLAPCTRVVHKNLLHSVFEFFSCNTLIGLWDVAPEIGHGDLIALGFARLSHSKMVVKHNGNSCKFSREGNLLDFPFVTASEEDEQWVKSRSGNA